MTTLGCNPLSAASQRTSSISTPANLNDEIQRAKAKIGAVNREIQLAKDRDELDLIPTLQAHRKACIAALVALKKQGKK